MTDLDAIDYDGLYVAIRTFIPAVPS
jgi:hypothetical protein